MHTHPAASRRAGIAVLGLAAALACSPNALANPDTQPGTLPDGWPANAQASAYYQCHFGARGHNGGSVMVWADAHHRVVALSSPRADDPVPAWTHGAGHARDFNARFRTVAFEAGGRALVADRSGRGMAMQVQDRLGPCVRSVEE